MFSDVDLSTIELIKKYKLIKNGMKALGQNFLIDEEIVQRIVKSALPIEPSCEILEIGPGPLSLTKAIAEISKTNIICIEKDESFRELHCHACLPNVQFVYADALKIRLSDLSARPKVIIANLPYNISTTLLSRWLLLDTPIICKMVLMFQKEVAERIIASPGSRNYGKMSILSQAAFDVEWLLSVPPAAFIPEPTVHSAVVLFRPLLQPLPSEQLPSLSKLLDISFRSRRKKLKSNLALAYSSPTISAAFDHLQISLSARPEALSVQQYRELLSLLPASHQTNPSV